MAQKKRLDQLVHELLPAYSKTQIQSWIMQGKIKVDGQTVTKSGVATPIDALITYDIEKPKYVSRAGFKLEKALDHFGIDVSGLTVLDAGLSTGGFTDCMLQRGVSKVIGIDVGYGQAHEQIRADARVTVKEQTNLRDLTPEQLGFQVDMITLDLSFISVLKVMEAVSALLKSGGKLVVLIKPQFEAQRHEVGKGGIVKDAAVHEAVVQKVRSGIEAHGFTCRGVIESPITGTDGNKEFLTYCIMDHRV